MLFREAEGLTVISTIDAAQELGLDFAFACRMITCNIHSSLQAVGFIAEMSRALTEKGIGINPVSAFYHDHLFVPIGREQDAISTLEELVTHAIAARAVLKS